MEIFLRSKIEVGKKVTIDLDNLCGIGGESIVIKQHKGQGKSKTLIGTLKLIPLGGAAQEIKTIVKENQSQIQQVVKSKRNTRKRTSKVEEVTKSKISRSSDEVEISPSDLNPKDQPEILNQNLHSLGNPTRTLESEFVGPSAMPKSSVWKKSFQKEFNIITASLQNTDSLADHAEAKCSSFKHQNIIKYQTITYDIIDDQLFMIVAMPYYNCTLWKLLKTFAKLKPISIDVRFKLFESIFAGAKFIQEKGFKHLDLKPANILLNTNADGTWNMADCVITDFGLSGRKDKESGRAGTPAFTSPEQLTGNGVPESDNFAFGKMMVMLFCEWQTAWNLLFGPVKKGKTTFGSERAALFDVISKLLKVSLELFVIKTYTKYVIAGSKQPYDVRRRKNPNGRCQK